MNVFRSNGRYKSVSVSVSVSQSKSKRNHRTEELIQKTIAHILKKEVQDSRLSSVTITGVDLSPDFKQATVFFTLLEATQSTLKKATQKLKRSESAIKKAEEAFAKATGFFRVQLSKQAELRHTPQLSFKYDLTAIAAARISDLLSGDQGSGIKDR